jgi:hypothetical protein
VLAGEELGRGSLPRGPPELKFSSAESSARADKRRLRILSMLRVGTWQHSDHVKGKQLSIAVSTLAD